MSGFVRRHRRLLLVVLIVAFLAFVAFVLPAILLAFAVQRGPS